jgi:acetylornithine deacetylase/succinyl-diaminopimelate desuccinylase family protein
MPHLLGEERLADYLQALLESFGAKVQRQSIEPETCNIIAVFNPGGQPRLVFDTHMDTVCPSAEMSTPFQAREVDDCIAGLGACDQKGGMAAALLALSYLSQAQAFQAEVTFAATAREESGSQGARALVPTFEGQADLVIISEPTSLRLLTAGKGVGRWKVTVQGVAAHGSVPESGRNAIYGACELITALRHEFERKQQNIVSHPLLGRPTMNIGRIEGGTEVNVVPDSCWLLLERRLLPGEDLEAIEAQITTLVRQLASAGQWPDIHLERGICMSPSEVPAEHPSVIRIQQVLHGRGLDKRPAGAPFSTDGGAWYQACHPVVIFGPGDIGTAHSPRECVAINELVTAVQVLCDLFSGQQV